MDKALCIFLLERWDSFTQFCCMNKLVFFFFFFSPDELYQNDNELSRKLQLHNDRKTQCIMKALVYLVIRSNIDDQHSKMCVTVLSLFGFFHVIALMNFDTVYGSVNSIWNDFQCIGNIFLWFFAISNSMSELVCPKNHTSNANWFIGNSIRFRSFVRGEIEWSGFVTCRQFQEFILLVENRKHFKLKTPFLTFWTLCCVLEKIKMNVSENYAQFPKV